MVLKSRSTILTIGLLILLLCGSSAFAASDLDLAPTPMPTPTASPEPVVHITSPKSATTRRYGLFPLKIPAYVMRGITWPIIRLVRVVENKWMKKGSHAGDAKPNQFSVFPIFQVGGGEGIGLGFSFQVNDIFNAGDLYADYTFFFDVENRANLSFLGNAIPLGGRPFQYEFITAFRNRNEQAFFGIGPASEESSRAEYSYDETTVGVNLSYEPVSHLKVNVPLQFISSKTGTGEGPVSVQAEFPPGELPGFGQRINYFVTGIGLAHDTRSDKVYPLKGGYRAFRFTRFQDVSAGSFSFNQYDFEVEQFIPLWAPRYVLLLRNAWEFQQATGNGEVPFNLLADLDHYSPLRGFTVGRFKDEASVIFNFEYRFPIWSYASIWDQTKGTFLDGFVFADTGKVFPGITQFNFDDWRYSVGGGFRVQMNESLLMKFEAGYGGEGALIFFKIGTSR